MASANLYEAQVLLRSYHDKKLIYLFDEDILGMGNRAAVDLNDRELKSVKAFVEAIGVLESVYDHEANLISDFLLLPNTCYPFSGETPYKYVRRQPPRALSLLFFVQCMETYMNNQLKLEHCE